MIAREEIYTQHIGAWSGARKLKRVDKGLAREGWQAAKRRMTGGAVGAAAGDTAPSSSSAADECETQKGTETQDALYAGPAVEVAPMDGKRRLLACFSGALCWVDASVTSVGLWDKLEARGCGRAPTRLCAAIFIVNDPKLPGLRALWHSILRGAFLASPAAFHDDGEVRGCVIKYVPASRRSRMVHITAAFTEKHKEIVAIMTTCCPSWKFVHDLEALIVK